MTPAANAATRATTPQERAFVEVDDPLAGCTGSGQHIGRAPAEPGESHGAADGSLDESARRLSHEELRVARSFAARGHAVRSLPERPGRGRTADLEVCGNPVEVKSWLSLADRNGVTPGRRSVVNKLISAEGQSPFVVLVSDGSGLSAADATSGVARYASERPWSSIRAVRVIGDGFDLSWQRPTSLTVGRSQRSSPQLGLGV